MKEYTAPQIAVIDNFEELNVDAATLEWSLDGEENQIVVTSCYEKVDAEAYLKEQGLDPQEYDEDYLEETRFFRKRPEVVEVARVDCDQVMKETVREWDDEHGHHKESTTKEQLVAFEIGDVNYDLKESMEMGEEALQSHYQELKSHMIGFRKDGRWWFLDLAEMKLAECQLYDEETDDEVSVPFSCEEVYPLSLGTAYVRGEAYDFDAYDFVGMTVRFICEDGEAQYGVTFDGTPDVALLNKKNWEGELDEPWTKISLMTGDLTIREVRDEEGLKKEGICEGFWRARSMYDREREDSKPLEYEVVHGADAFVRVIQGDVMHLIPVERELRYIFGQEKKAKSQLLADYLTGDGEIFGIKIKERVGDYFVVKQEVPVGSRKKVQYRIVFEDTYVGGVWDDAEVVYDADRSVDYVPLFKVKKDGYWGVINEVGTVVVPVHFTKISALRPGYAAIPAEREYEDYTVAYDLFLEEFGRKGLGHLVDCGEEKKDSADKLIWDDFSGEFDVEKAKGVHRCDSFLQTIPCEYERIATADPGLNFFDGIQVEKMGRVAVYGKDGRLKENFKPGNIG